MIFININLITKDINHSYISTILSIFIVFYFSGLIIVLGNKVRKCYAENKKLKSKIKELEKEIKESKENTIT